MISELVGPTSAYRGPPIGDPRWRWDAFGPEAFSPNGHAVLDIGAHIGVFSRLALSLGAERVLGVEPEPENAALWRTNCEAALGSGTASLLEAAKGQHERKVDPFSVAVRGNAME